MGTSPQKIGRYEIIGELGKGAMGLVYKALDPMIGRTVAMKTMRMDVHGMEAEEMLKRFQNEARAAGVLNQRNIVTIYDAGEQDGMFYIAMEFIEGVTLHSLIVQNRVLPVEQIIDVSSQVLAGLDYAHSHGVIHRDVKPANIMIMPDNTVKIMDFGIAKAGGGLTSAGQVLGTPNYMSPEQVKGRTLDGRSDLFSFGVILYEMVTGEKPFTGQNVTTIIYKIVNEHPIAPRELDVTIHPGLSAVISKALAKSPDERYQSGAALTKDLVNYKSLGAGSAEASGSMVALPADASDKTIAFDSQAMAKASSGSMAAQPGPAAAAAPAGVSPAAVKIAQGIDSTVNVARQKIAPVVEKTKQQPKGVLIGIVLVVLLAIGGGIGYMKHRASVRAEEEAAHQRQEQQQVEAQQKAAIEQQVKSAPSPTSTATPDTTAAAASPDTTKVDKTKASKTPSKTTQPAKAAPSPTASAPPQPVATTGELQVTSNPPGAQVQVDSALQGTTPFTARNLTPGSHNVAISKTGFQSVTQKVDVTAGKMASLGVTLQSVPVATLTFASQPEGANIVIDGKDTGKVTPATLTVDPGAHKLLLKKDGFKDATVTTPALKVGQGYDFRPFLEAGKNGENPFKRMFGSIPEGKGAVNLKSDPKGATILMNGFSAPKPTPFKLVLDPGTYQITLKLDGYKPATKSITIEKGKTGEADVTLEKQ